MDSDREWVSPLVSVFGQGFVPDADVSAGTRVLLIECGIMVIVGKAMILEGGTWGVLPYILKATGGWVCVAESFLKDISSEERLHIQAPINLFIDDFYLLEKNVLGFLECIVVVDGQS